MLVYIRVNVIRCLEERNDRRITHANDNTLCLSAAASELRLYITRVVSE